jgi:hypothetical protein
LRGNQPRVVPETAELARPIVRSAARLHRHQTGGKVGKPAHEVLTRNGLTYHNMFTSIDRVDLHDIFGKINTNTGNCVHDFPLPQMCNGYHDGTRRCRCHRDGSSLPIPAAKAEIAALAHVRHVFVKASARVNNRAENSHQPTRERERRMQAQLKAEVPANSATDDRGWETVVVIKRFRFRHHAILRDRPNNLTMPSFAVEVTTSPLWHLP